MNAQSQSIDIIISRYILFNEIKQFNFKKNIKIIRFCSNFDKNSMDFNLKYSIV